MGEDLAYQIILPNNYETSERRYPVLYLLHGLFGTFQNWIELTNLIGYAKDLELIIVTPEGKDSWYTNSETDGAGKFEDYFLNKMMPAIESIYRINGNRRCRAIAGNSMGGYGALKFALKRPDLFSCAGSFSGAFHAPQGTDETSLPGWDELRGSVMRAFGPDGSSTRTENDLFRIVENVSENKNPELPFLYFDCGLDDNFIDVNRAFDNELTQNSIKHEFREFAGGHDWEYWDRRIRDFLPVVDSILNAEAGHFQG